jgi:hypothetical protein
MGEAPRSTRAIEEFLEFGAFLLYQYVKRENDDPFY